MKENSILKFSNVPSRESNKLAFLGATYALTGIFIVTNWGYFVKVSEGNELLCSKADGVSFGELFCSKISAVVNFRLLNKDRLARAGEFKTLHGVVKTPVFMPVGTQASVKSLTFEDLNNLGAQIILSNTYHLYLRPGSKAVQKLGGLHQFMHWDKPILTDSGGFQVMSFGSKKTVKPMGATYESIPFATVDDDGVTFRSHLDGSLHRFTPESSIKIQHQLGADIIMAFDEATVDHLGKDYARVAMERTHSWAKRSFSAHKKLGGNQSLFGIIQGSAYEDLRKDSAKFISDLPFDGIALGGEAIGFNNQATKKILSWVDNIWPDDKPHYAMGVGEVETVFYCIEGGVDMFDCVSPTRRARNGSLYISPKNGGNLHNKFTFSISNTRCLIDKQPIDPGCECFTCQNFTRAYLRHLFMAKELTYHRLATIHNLHFMINLVSQIRVAITNKQFQRLKKAWLKI